MYWVRGTEVREYCLRCKYWVRGTEVNWVRKY